MAQLLPVIQKLLAVILFLYLAKFFSRLSQYYNFIQNIKYNAKINVSDNGNATFQIPLPDLIKYFGFRYKQEDFLTLLIQNKKQNNQAFALLIVLWTIVSILIAYFLLNISLPLIGLALASLLFLMLIF